MSMLFFYLLIPNLSANPPLGTVMFGDIEDEDEDSSEDEEEPIPEGEQDI